jgi:hypothetical protein
MNSVIIGVLIVLLIILLTVVILSFQLITYPSIFKSDVEEEEEDKKEDEEVNDANDFDNIEAGNDIDTSYAPLDVDPNRKEKCCYINNFHCPKDRDCLSGVEKRCGHYADKDCNESMINCAVMNKDNCKSYPNNNYCAFTEHDNKCKQKESSRNGEEITCERFNRFKEANVPHMNYNCESDLFIF